jgi:hypothetical protein
MVHGANFPAMGSYVHAAGHDSGGYKPRRRRRHRPRVGDPHHGAGPDARLPYEPDTHLGIYGYVQVPS